MSGYPRFGIIVGIINIGIALASILAASSIPATESFIYINTCIGITHISIALVLAVATNRIAIRTTMYGLYLVALVSSFVPYIAANSPGYVDLLIGMITSMMILISLFFSGYSGFGDDNTLQKSK